MKVISAQEMAALEKRAYQEGASDHEFMEKAGQGIALAVQAFIRKYGYQGQPVWLLCGKGNNGGDAFVAGRYLLQQGYDVLGIQLDKASACSLLCQKNRERFLAQGGKLFSHLPTSFSAEGLIIDGLFGTGFKGQITSPHDALVREANASKRPILAIDIPSGLDGSTGDIQGDVIHATETFFLALPKTGFFLGKGWNVVGRLMGVDFGLAPHLIEEVPAAFHLVSEGQVAQFLPPIERNRHKYQVGDVMGLAGSPNMPGAALLSSLAAFRGGCGMVHLFHPRGMESLLAASPYELIKIPYAHEDLSPIRQQMPKASAIFVGPGLGNTASTQALLQSILPTLQKPCVMDADALNVFAEHPFQLPSQTIFTPHAGEMRRLLHDDIPLTLTQELLHTCQNYAEKHQITLILKGAPTFIFHPQRPIHVNPTGDPGMATAGSGDVLTGLLAALLAQGLSCHEAALLGVYLHGLAGECAARERQTSYGMIASDLIAHLSTAYAFLTTQKVSVHPGERLPQKGTK